jgi:hypothetical protein
LHAIAGYAPPRLYVSVDGPRPGNTNDQQTCNEVKEIIAEWQNNHPATQVHSLYQPANLGCGTAVSTAITWFFDQEEMGIVLEDDCLPNQSFFVFCENLLHRYHHNKQVMHIGGSNFLDGALNIDSTYYFSKYPHIWGWASWKRAWKLYQFRMPHFQEFTSRPDFKRYYDDDVFIRTKSGEVNTWDSQWVYTVLMNDGLSILPLANMVVNLGFSEHGGTHLQQKPSWYSGKTFELEQITHPHKIVHNAQADDYVFNKVFKRGISYRLKKTIKKLLFKK